MTRPLATLALLLAVAGVASAQQPQQYQTGRKAPTLGQFQALQARSQAAHLTGLADFPDAKDAKWDSREHGWVGPPKNQGNCGSCWDFSGTRVVEIAAVKAGHGKADDFVLSEQYTLSCYENGGCNGDDNTTVLKHAVKVGLPFTKDYGPYHARETDCAYKPSMPLFKIADWTLADGNVGYEQVGNTQKIKNAIKATGCVGCAIAADGAFSNVRPGQVFHGRSRSINHDVVLIGWDDTKEPGTTAWLLLNSWGNWCDGGTCLIAAGANQVGTEPVVAIVKDVNPPPVPPAPPTPPTPPPGPSPCPHFMGVHVGLWTLLIGFVAGGVVVFFVMRPKATPPSATP